MNTPHPAILVLPKFMGIPVGTPTPPMMNISQLVTAHAEEDSCTRELHWRELFGGLRGSSRIIPNYPFMVQAAGVCRVPEGALRKLQGFRF